MLTLNNVHQQFAEFFKSESIKPFAFLVSKKLPEGHICLDLHDIEEELSENSFYDIDKVLKDKQALKSAPLVSAGNKVQPFVLHREKLYLYRYFSYETQILMRLKAFTENEKQHLKKRIYTGNS